MVTSLSKRLDERLKVIDSLGVPLFGWPHVSLGTRSGRFTFVDPARGRNALDGGQGFSPTYPFKTLQYAHDNGCISGQGDTIFAYPGDYAEDLLITKDYVSIVGAIFAGYARPDLKPATAGAAALDVKAQGFACKHFRFASLGSLAAAAAAAGRLVRIRGNGFHLQDIVVDGKTGDNANSVLLGLKGDADDDSYTASEGLIEDFMIRDGKGRGLAFEAGEAPLNGVGSTHCVLRRGRFINNTGIDLITLDAAAGGAVYSVQDVLIELLAFVSPKNKATWIDFITSNGGAAGDQTGLIRDCDFADTGLEGTNAIKVAGTGVVLAGIRDATGIVNTSAF